MTFRYREIWDSLSPAEQAGVLVAEQRLQEHVERSKPRELGDPLEVVAEETEAQLRARVAERYSGETYVDPLGDGAELDI